MMPQTLEALMKYEWKPQFEELEDGSYRATIPPLRDFEVFGTRAEVEAEWLDALRSHLEAYVTVGKQVPLPSVTLANQGEGNTSRGRVVLSKDTQPA